MRGNDKSEATLFSYVNLEARIPVDHPLRRVRAMVDEALKGMDRDFEGMYADEGAGGSQGLSRQCQEPGRKDGGSLSVENARQHPADQDPDGLHPLPSDP